MSQPFRLQKPSLTLIIGSRGALRDPMWALERLYTTKATRYKVADIKRALYLRGDILHLFLIVMNTERGHPLEIVKADRLYNDPYQVDSLLIIGAAQTKAKAEELLITIADDVYAATGAGDMSGYFMKEWERGKAVKIV